MTDTATPPGRRVDGSMSLLVDMMTNTLDESYAAAARRRAGDDGGPAGPAGEPDRPSARRRFTAVILLLALGLVTGTAAAQVRKRQAAASTVRGQLVGEVHRRTGESDALAKQADRLRRDVSAEQDAALRSSSSGVSVARQLADLQLAVGVSAVTGPGLVVRLDDAPNSDVNNADRGGQAGSGRVLDRDLQDAVNGLRLSALTAIRSAGEAILVDYRPLSPPYTLRAIGNPGSLEARFADSAAGRRLSTYTSLYGLQVVVRRSDKQTLPGAGTPSLRLATPAGGGS